MLFGKTLYQWLLVLGIVILTNLWLNMAVGVIFDVPEYSNFCVNSPDKASSALNEESCLQVNGQWVVDSSKNTYCDMTTRCYEDFDVAQKEYSIKAFMAMNVVGMIGLILGAILIADFVLGNGLTGAGIIAIFIGSVSNWNSVEEGLRLAVLSVAMILLIVIGIKRGK